MIVTAFCVLQSICFAVCVAYAYIASKDEVKPCNQDAWKDIDEDLKKRKERLNVYVAQRNSTSRSVYDLADHDMHARTKG